MIAGLEKPDTGSIAFDATEITNQPAERRGFGMVFQNYALFPHLNVFENVAFGLRARHMPSGEIGDRVTSALGLVQLPGYEKRRVDELSGGQQQRVALRAPSPSNLLSCSSTSRFQILMLPCGRKHGANFVN